MEKYQVLIFGKKLIKIKIGKNFVLKCSIKQCFIRFSSSFGIFKWFNY